MNQHFIDFLKLLKSIQWQEYAIVGCISFVVFQATAPLNTRSRYQITAGAFFFLWLFRWVTGTVYHQALNPGVDLPFSKLFLPLCAFVFTVSMLYDKGQLWAATKTAFMAAVIVATVTMFLL
jgi:hypothetical protein